MRPTRWLWLYRPPAPSVRAQSIQVVHMAHAMARRGHRVTLAVDPAQGHRVPEAELLGFYGLESLPELRLVQLPVGGTAASLAFRALVAAWLARDDGRGVIYARSKRYARALLRWPGRRPRLVLEVHEVDSAQQEEQGQDGAALRRLEAEVFAAAQGVVANCPGTLELLRQVHPLLPPAISAHNATHPSRIRAPHAEGRGVGYVGSVRAYKGLDTLALAARELSAPVTLIGARSEEEASPLVDLSGGRLQVRPPVPHVHVPDELSRFRALVLPLSQGLFGQKLTSPLKLWDYLASGVPFAGADLPTLADAAPGAYLPYTPDQPESLRAALERLLAEDALRRQLSTRARVRTWASRAAEVESFVAGLPR